MEAWEEAAILHAEGVGDAELAARIGSFLLFTQLHANPHAATCPSQRYRLSAVKDVVHVLQYMQYLQRPLDEKRKAKFGCAQ